MTYAAFPALVFGALVPCALLAGELLGAQGAPCAPNWVPAFGGLPGVSGALGTVNAFATFDDGHGPALYVGGGFASAGGVAVNNIARWDGASWAPLADGVGDSNFFVAALAVYDDGRGGGPALYAAGYFPSASGVEANNVARWDGTRWTALGTGVNNAVQALAVFDDGSGPALFAAGFFRAAGAAANRIAKWNGTSWAPLGSGLNDTAYALTVYDDGLGAGPALYAGGLFTLAGGVSASRVARWNGASWAALGGGANERVAALTVFDSGSGPALIAAGAFDRAGAAAANRIARWNGTSWAALGGGLTSGGTPAPRVDALTVLDDGGGPALYAAGRFTRAGGAVVNHVARWNGTSWGGLANGLTFPGVVGGAFALGVFERGAGRELYAGGTFTGAGGARAYGIASWNGARWAPTGRGANDAVAALATLADPSGAGPALFAGGAFTSVGGASARHVARWNGRWTALGDGTNDAVRALNAFDDGHGPAPALFAGGDFTSAGGAPANHVARWDGASWTPLGAGTDGAVRALATCDDGSGPALHAGGSFASAGGAPASAIARWNGAVWAPADLGLLGEVAALAVFDDGHGPALYAGGTFAQTGRNVVVNHVAKWNGANWSPLAGGVAGPLPVSVDALAVFDDGRGPALYAGGRFTSAGGVPANHVARWDGAGWSAVASGVDDLVSALAVFDDGAGPALHAGGAFLDAGGAAANRGARWDGTRWTPLAGGLSGPVLALAVFDDRARGGPALFAAGSFTSALDSRDSFLARWQACPDTTPPLLVCPGPIAVLDPRAGPPGEIVTFTVTASDDRDPSPSIVCAPPSGSLFPPGITLVQCKATDGARNQASCSFPVTVRRKQGQ